MQISKKFRTLILLVTAGLLLTYIILRVINIPLTYDESFTFFNFIKTPIASLFIYLNPNNHFLNSLFIRALSSLFGESEFIIRLPNIIAFIIFLIFSYKLLKKYFSLNHLVFIYPLFNLNPFVLEFFSLARGYGLSLGFVIASIYYFSEVIEKHTYTSKKSFYAITLSSLAVLSNLASLNFFLGALLSLIGFYIFDLLKKKNYNVSKVIFNKFIVYIFINVLLLGTLLVIPIMLMRLNNQLFFGGNTGFWQDTVTSLISSSLYQTNSNPNLISLIAAVVVVLIIVIALNCFLVIRRQNIAYRNIYIFSFSTIFLAALSTIVQNLLLDTNFLIERTAIFFIPLFYLLLLFCFKTLVKKSNRFLYLLAIIFILNLTYFVSVANINFSYFWRFDQSSDQIVKDISELSKGMPSCIITEGQYDEALKYYLYRNNLTERFRIYRFNESAVKCSFLLLPSSATPDSKSSKRYKEYASAAVLYTLEN